jgi:hypothetical protein
MTNERWFANRSTSGKHMVDTLLKQTTTVSYLVSG